jgi:hypothetical protein
MIYLTLGDVIFQNFEIPQQISFGQRQRVAIHNLIGGGRVVDTLGAQPSEIAFGGIFSGSDASARTQILDTACAAGLVLPLGWEEFFYNVMIVDFAADYKKSYWIPFEIRCAVVTDTLAAVLTSVVKNLELVNSDLAAAAQWAIPAGLGDQNYTSSGAIAAQIADIASVEQTGGSLIDFGTVIDSESKPFETVSALTSALQGTESLASAAYMRGYLARAVRNISLGSL